MILKIAKFFKIGKSLIIIFALAIIAGLFFVFSGFSATKTDIPIKNDSPEIENNTINPIEDVNKEGRVSNKNTGEEPLLTNANISDVIRAIYVTSWSASSENYINYILKLARENKINAVVIDIKDYSGYVSYDANVLDLDSYGAKSIKVRNIDLLIERLKNENLYLIARIAVFQDPVLAKARPDLAVKSISTNDLWYDRKGLAWTDPGLREVWDYNIAIAKDASLKGFDEINFDYIRFPSDGDLKDMVFSSLNIDASGQLTKRQIMRQFFKYLRGELQGIKISADLFGLTTVNYDDLGIGQVIEDAFSYFDYISPMVYPSHYASGFLGYENPADYPYEVVKYSMDRAVARLNNYNANIENSNHGKIVSKIRPWLQDFNLGAVYDSVKVKAQIQATMDALGDSYNGFMLWAPSNVYTNI